MGKKSVIVNMIGYDEQGHTVYTKFGNGTETTYAYDRERQRLQEMALTTAGSAVMQNRAKLGGMSSHSYQYDELNRPIRATGKAKNATYDMAMTFNSMSIRQARYKMSIPRRRHCHTAVSPDGVI